MALSLCPEALRRRLPTGVENETGPLRVGEGPRAGSPSEDSTRLHHSARLHACALPTDLQKKETGKSKAYAANSGVEHDL